VNLDLQIGLVLKLINKINKMNKMNKRIKLVSESLEEFDFTNSENPIEEFLEFASYSLQNDESNYDEETEIDLQDIKNSMYRSEGVIAGYRMILKNPIKLDPYVEYNHIRGYKIKGKTIIILWPSPYEEKSFERNKGNNISSMGLGIIGSISSRLKPLGFKKNKRRIPDYEIKNEELAKWTRNKEYYDEVTVWQNISTKEIIVAWQLDSMDLQGGGSLSDFMKLKIN
jgi:hypothetical protein